MIIINTINVYIVIIIFIVIKDGIVDGEPKPDEPKGDEPKPAEPMLVPYATLPQPLPMPDSSDPYAALDRVALKRAPLPSEYQKKFPRGKKKGKKGNGGEGKEG